MRSRGSFGWMLVIALGACGSSEAPALQPASVITPEPPSVAAPETPPPPPTEPAPAASEVPTVELAPGGLLAMTDGTIEMWGESIAVDVVAYSPEVQEAITRQLRAMLRDALDEFDLNGGDGEYPNTASASCHVTLALADLVSYACQAYLSIGRGGGDELSFARTWEIAASAVHELEVDDLLVPGADYATVTAAYDADPDGAVALTPTGIAFVDYEGHSAEVPYADLGTLLNRSSILSRVPGALDRATVVTPLAEDAAPPETVSVFAEPRPFAAAVLLGARAGSGWLFATQNGTLLGVDVPSTFEADATTAARLGGAASSVPWSTPARLGAARLRRGMQLRAAPHGRPSGAPLLAGTALVTVLGDVAGGASRTGGGQWALVVASESQAGWVPSGALGEAVTNAVPGVDRFVDALPAETRASVRPRTVLVGLGDDTVAYAETTPGTTMIAYYAPDGRRLLGLTHAGTLVDVRTSSTFAGGSGQRLLLVAFQLPDAAATWLWEVYVVQDGASAAAPVLSVTLPLPAAPARERVTIATSVTRHGTFHPLVVRGPGRTESLYTWNGTALVAPAPPPAQ